MAAAVGADAGAGPLVEWRVFFPLLHHHGTAPPPPLSSIVLGEVFSAWPVEAEDGVEDRVDTYALVGSDGVGLKHRGKKGKLEVKVRVGAFADEAGCSAGVEAWSKFKLGKKGQKKGAGSGDDDEAPCMQPAQQAELERILTEHGLLDARLQHGALVCEEMSATGFYVHACMCPRGNSLCMHRTQTHSPSRSLCIPFPAIREGGGGREVVVAKSRLVGRLRLADALGDGGDDEHGAASSSSSSSSSSASLGGWRLRSVFVCMCVCICGCHRPW
jgi:hypothetical protein